ncbi:hypothetical protein AB0F81_35095 [Actinoplanes sp. NPDC024001]|uniref:hypothetical protein n=1 Tax=Actinoplanes sp. NPDC024001 TaxID=3154598 RepID=UPI0033CF168F
MTESTDTDIRDALLAYTGDEPPLPFGYEQVVTAGRRVRRRRRAAAAAAGSLVFVAVAGVAVTGLPHDPAPFAVGGPSWPALDPAPFCAAAAAPPSTPAIAPTTVVRDLNDYRVRIPVEPADHAAARLSCRLATVVPPLLPGFRFHLIPGAPEDGLPLRVEPAQVFDPAQPQTTLPVFSAGALVSDDEGVGEIGFGAWPAGETVAEATANCAGCEVRTGPDGATVLIDVMTGDAGLRTVNVWVHRADTVTFATTSNAVPDPATDADRQEVGRPDPPLTLDQLVRLAAAPELTLFP